MDDKKCECNCKCGCGSKDKSARLLLVFFLFVIVILLSGIFYSMQGMMSMCSSSSKAPMCPIMFKSGGQTAK
ncbi:MAG: hypothetical protein H6754_05990 [Candidatus Omnitrophica bacterium]|nr:hypothetical protein [Candidatus Omnitrophota bacterium]